MAQYIDLYTTKAHLNLDQEFTGDDLYLLQLMDAAENVVQNNLDTPLYTYSDNNGYLPSPIVQAILLLIGTWYDNRESDSHSSMTTVPHGVEYLLSPFKNYGQHQTIRYAR